MMIKFDNKENLFSIEQANQDKIDIEELKSCVSKIKNEPLLIPAQAFKSNIEAILSLLLLPSFIFGAGAGIGWSSAIVSEKKFNSKKEQLEALRANKAKMPTIDPYYLQQLIDKEEKVKQGMKSVISSSIVLSWTAIETLSRDAWITCVNSLPDPLAKNALRQKGDEVKTLKTTSIGKYNFDLSKFMGTLLVEEEEKYKFGNPDQIVKAYQAIFPKFSVEDMWKTFKQDLRLLSFTRNLIVHNSSIVDEKFIKKCNLDLPVDSILPLTNSNSIEFTQTVISAGCKLIESIDNWLKLTMKIIESRT
ncbi:hypothetical protein QUF70_12375 [Desulfobacterales bacterium HSG17]|nr:hypothetical protein [Desulfobacterales bacterium HSG17]